MLESSSSLLKVFLSYDSLQPAQLASSIFRSFPGLLKVMTLIVLRTEVEKSTTFFP